GTWLHRIVYTKAIDLLRARGRDAPMPEEDSASHPPDDDRLGGAPTWSRPPDEILFGTETRKALDKALMELTPLQRLVFEMREVEGRAVDEVVDILRVRAGSARVHI